MTLDTLKETSFSELLNRLQADLVRLVDTEKKLAKTEMSLKWEEAKKQGAALAVALVLSLLAGFCFTASAVLALSNILDPWLAALTVGAVLLVACAVACAKLKANAVKLAPIPQHTIGNLKQDVSSIGETVR